MYVYSLFKEIKLKLIKHKWSKEIVLENNKLKELDKYHSIIAFTFDLLVCLLAIIFNSIYWSKFGWYIYPITIIVISTRMRCFTAFVHEFSHETLAKNIKINNFIGFISGIITFQSILNYRVKHLKDHHAHLGDTNIDPDAKLKKSLGIDKKMSKTDIWLKIILYPFLPNIIFNNIIATFKGRCKAMFYAKTNELKNDYRKLIFSWVVILLVLILCDSFHYFVLYWFVPYFTLFQVILWYTFLAEHYPLSTIYSLDINMSRNRSGNIIESFFLNNHGVCYHGIHHENPIIPWWNLKKSFTLKLKDKDYAESQKLHSGGIFTKGQLGAPSMFSQIFKEMML